MTNRSFSTIAVVVVFAALIVSPANVHADSASSFIATGGSGSLVNLGGGEGSMLWTLTGTSLSFTLAGDINVGVRYGQHVLGEYRVGQFRRLFRIGNTGWDVLSIDPFH